MIAVFLVTDTSQLTHGKSKNARDAEEPLNFAAIQQQLEAHRQTLMSQKKVLMKNNQKEKRMQIAVLILYMCGSLCFLVGSALSLYAAIQ